LSTTQEAIIEAIKKETVLKAIAVELAKRPEILHTITEAALGRVATKEDIKELKTDIIRQIFEVKNDIKAYVDARYDDLVARIDGLDKRINGLDKRIDALDKRIDGLDKRIDALDRRISFLQWTMFVWLSIISILLSALLLGP